MIFRMTLVVIAIVGATQFAFAQTAQLAAVQANPQLHPSKDVQIILEMRFVIISDDLIKRLLEQWKSRWPKLPDMGSFVVCDQEQGELLTVAASGDQIGPIPPEMTLRLLNGEKRQVPPLKPPWPSQTYQATVSDGYRTIQVCLTWAKAKDGAETLPAIDAEVPVGSHLLVHTHTFSEARAAASSWDQCVDWLFHRRPKPRVDYQRGFLLVTPRIVPQEQE